MDKELNKVKRKAVSSILALSTLSLSLFSMNSTANVSAIPVVGGVVNSGEILKNQVHSSINYVTETTRDALVFTIAGVSLDAYILSLPLDTDVKARIITQLSDPTYSIPLGYFLYTFVDKYGDMGSEDAFKSYLQTQYDDATLNTFSHSLFTLNDVPKEAKTHVAEGHHQGLKVDRKFIANMVVLYDALVEIGEWNDLDTLPDQYTYLTASEQDRAIIQTVQPIILDGMSKVLATMDEGEVRNALAMIIEDGKPENKNKINNKAEALTISLIDFVRLNVLKSYRQFVYKKERQKSLNQWLQNTLSENPERLVSYLESRQQRPLAVQVTVDGLQQGLMQGLVAPESTPFIKQIHQDHITHQGYQPLNEKTVEPEHQQQMSFLETLANEKYDDPHYLPFFKELYQFYEPSIADVGISSTPTISVRNLPIIKTGAKVSGEGGTGIPNFHFVDREEDRAYYFFGNDALQLDRIMNDNNVQTMFDRLNYLVTLNCNAQYDWNAHTTYDALVNLGAGEALRDFGEKRCLRELNQRAEVEKEITALRDEIITDINEYSDIFALNIYSKLTQQWKIKQKLKKLSRIEPEGMPDYTLIYNPWSDHFAHFTGPFSDEIIMPTGELNRLDYWLTQLILSYKKAGVYDRTLWGMAGDHGLSPIYYALNPEKQVLEALEEDLAYPLVIKKISSDEGEGPKITNAFSYESNKEVDVVVASTAGGNFMMDFFTSPKGWKVQPTYADLTFWQAVNAAKIESFDIISETVDRLKESLEYLAVRESNCNEEECAVRLVGYKKEVGYKQDQRLDEIILKRGDKLFYYGVNHSPQLLELNVINPYLPALTEEQTKQYNQLYQQCVLDAKKGDVVTWCSEQQWRTLTAFTAKPDSINQLAQLYEEDRAGTVNLFPKSGIGFNTKVPGRHAGEHYLEKDAFIGFWGKPIGKNRKPLIIEENGSLAPTLFEYLTKEPVEVGKNGWGYPSLLPKLDIKLDR